MSHYNQSADSTLILQIEDFIQIQCKLFVFKLMMSSI